MSCAAVRAAAATTERSFGARQRQAGDAEAPRRCLRLPRAATMSERILIVAPSWVGDAILSEPLIARLRAAYADPAVDVLAPPWCAPVYARMRGVREVIANPIGHGRLALRGRAALARTLRARAPEQRYTRAFVLPNSWKSALVPWLAAIPIRTGYRGESRWGLLTDVRRLGRRAPPRLVDRFVALAERRDPLAGGRDALAEGRDPLPRATVPVLVPDVANRAAALLSLGLAGDRPVAVLCPGAEYGPAKRWPAEHFAALAAHFIADGMRVWLVGSPNDRPAADAVVAAAGLAPPALANIAGATDLGTAIDLLSLAAVVVSNDSGLMHAAAAVGVPLVALFGSSSPAYTPPLSPRAQIAKIAIACSPCFKRECPLGHFKCMRDLEPDAVYHLARSGKVTAANPR
jgi:heptosyltransferase II